MQGAEELRCEAGAPVARMDAEAVDEVDGLAFEVAARLVADRGDNGALAFYEEEDGVVGVEGRSEPHSARAEVRFQERREPPLIPLRRKGGSRRGGNVQGSENGFKPFACPGHRERVPE